MTPETYELAKSLIPVFSAIIGTVVGVAGTVLVTYINRKSEERKHLSSLSFTAGIEDFKERINLAIAQNRKASILPLEFHVLNMNYLANILKKRNLSKDKLKKLMLAKNEILDVIKQAMIETEKI